MSAIEEDVELRDLVAQTLEKNGCLARLRAELRASIFLALDEDIKISKQQPLQNLRIQTYLETPEGRAMFCIVREFLEFFNLHFTISVFEPESHLNSIYHYEGRQKTANDLGFDCTDEPTVPLLQQLLKIAQTKSKVLDINLNLDNNSVKEDSLHIDSSYKKTDTVSTISKTSTINESSEYNDQELILEKNNFNATFNLSNPTVIGNNEISKNDCELKISPLKYEVCDNTNDNTDLMDDHDEANSRQDTNHIDKESIKSNKVLKNLHTKITELSNTVNSNSIPSDIISTRTSSIVSSFADDKEENSTHTDASSEAQNSKGQSFLNKEVSTDDVPLVNVLEYTFEKTDSLMPVLKDKDILDQPIISSEKIKSSLSSLSDLPPLSFNKPKTSNDILPLLPNSELKDNSDFKVLNKMFDMTVEYEDDFMCNSNELLANSKKTELQQSKNTVLEKNRNDLEKLNRQHGENEKNSEELVSEVNNLGLTLKYNIINNDSLDSIQNGETLSKHNNGSIS